MDRAMTSIIWRMCATGVCRRATSRAASGVKVKKRSMTTGGASRTSICMLSTQMVGRLELASLGTDSKDS